MFSQAGCHGCCDHRCQISASRQTYIGNLEVALCQARERASVAEAAVARLEEEVAALRAAAAAAAAAQSLPPIGAPSAHNGSRGTPSLAAMRRQWAPDRCSKALVARRRDAFARQLHAAENALRPESDMLGAEELLGQGSFGGVHKVFEKVTKTMWAIKRPVREVDKQVLIHEMLVYLCLPDNPHILRVHAMHDSNSSPALALECGECDLMAALAANRLSFAEELDCLVDVSMGTGHCHANGIVLCDLKPPNVILVHDGARFVAKVSDFGLACEIGRERPARCGTPGYIPHEVSLETTVSEPSADAFAFGAMLAIVALQPALREWNIFAHRMFQTPQETLLLQQLVQAEQDSYFERVEEIGHRTMLLPDYGFAREVTRPSRLNKMPGSAMTAVRKLIRTSTSMKPWERPAMIDIAPDLRAVASAVRDMMMRDRTMAASTAAAPAGPATLPSGSVEDVLLQERLLSPPASSSSGSSGSSTVSAEAEAVDAAELLVSVLENGGGAVGSDGGGSSAEPLPAVRSRSGGGGDTAEGGGSIASSAGPRYSGGGGDPAALSAVASVGSEDGEDGRALSGAERVVAPAAEEDGGKGWDWGWELGGGGIDCRAAVGFGV